MATIEETADSGPGAVARTVSPDEIFSPTGTSHGNGSFATTTAPVRQRRMVADDLLPGTLNLGHALPVIAQAFIYTRLVPVDPTTLVLLIVASVLGA